MSGDLAERAASLSEHSSQTARHAGNPRHVGTLALLAVLSTCLYGVIAWLSWQFDYDSVTTDRPIIAVLILFAAAFLAYLLSIRLAWRAPQSRTLLLLIAWSAVVFRVVMLFSVPIQEIDIYRYLWDGAVSTTGVSPFRYSPQQVREANMPATKDEALQTLVELRDGQPALAETLRRVHFSELPTIYPPVSQAVFATATATTQADSTVLKRVFIMKAWLIVFDLATLGLVIALLRLCQKPVGLCLIYAWCPLLLKEVANSGHLDAIAVFFTTLAVYLAARLFVRVTDPRSWLSTTANSTLIALVLALAVGAKLYPIVLAPLILLVVAKRIGWRYLPVPAAVFAAMTLLVLWPMLPREKVTSTESQNVVASHQPPQPAVPQATSSTDPSEGVTTFLRRWEMNDFIFLLLVENLKPTAELAPDRVAWFSVVPQSIRHSVVASVSQRFKIDAHEVPFLLTRAITGVAFIAVALMLAWRAARTPELSRFCEAGFLTLAWFWLLCPTQNPWYWTWALPLLPFARSRAWLAVSGLVLLYYLRFWLSYHWPDTPVLGIQYVGYAFFDFIVTWLEFAPWLFFLTLGFYLRQRSAERDVSTAYRPHPPCDSNAPNRQPKPARGVS